MEDFNNEAGFIPENNPDLKLSMIPTNDDDDGLKVSDSLYEQMMSQSGSEYDDFMTEYYDKRRFCPKCGIESNNMVSLVGYILNMDRKEEYADRNRSVCIKCGDKHIVHDRVGEAFVNEDIDNFLMDYENKHAKCPDCGCRIYTKLPVYHIPNIDKKDDYKQENPCTCHSCGSKHIKHDRLPVSRN